jgi:hypothetical protein
MGAVRQTHRAGEKLFIDLKLFIAVLGASNLTYVEPVLSEDLPTWIGCHVRALEFFGGTAEIWVPDNLKSGVTRPNRYEPELNPAYAELARHYGAAVIPARVRKPRDKAKVEQGVLLAQRWILAALRNRRFFSIDELRQAVKPLLEKLNNRVMRQVKKSRRQVLSIGETDALLRGAARGTAGEERGCRVPPKPSAGPVSRPCTPCRHTSTQPGPSSGRRQRVGAPWRVRLRSAPRALGRPPRRGQPQRLPG